VIRADLIGLSVFATTCGRHAEGLSGASACTATGPSFQATARAVGLVGRDVEFAGRRLAGRLRSTAADTRYAMASFGDTEGSNADAVALVGWAVSA